jgi:hypothetical protein
MVDSERPATVGDIGLHTPSKKSTIEIIENTPSTPEDAYREIYENDRGTILANVHELYQIMLQVNGSGNKPNDLKERIHWYLVPDMLDRLEALASNVSTKELDSIDMSQRHLFQKLQKMAMD